MPRAKGRVQRGGRGREMERENRGGSEGGRERGDQWNGRKGARKGSSIELACHHAITRTPPKEGALGQQGMR